MKGMGFDSTIIALQTNTIGNQIRNEFSIHNGTFEYLN